VFLALRLWLRLGRVAWEVRRRPFPEAIQGFLDRGDPPAAGTYVSARRLARVIDRVLHIGGWRPRCLLQAMVLFSLLRDQGDRAELVIGLDTEPVSKDAHAWVELDGIDVGPPPGRGPHAELVRYG
jgi:hypothetical protein